LVYQSSSIDRKICGSTVSGVFAHWDGWIVGALNFGTVNAASQLAFDDREKTGALPTIESVASNRIDATEAV